MPWSCNRSRSLFSRGVIGVSFHWMLAIAISSSSFAGEPADTGAQAEPVFNALLLDGRSQSGSLISLGPEAITLASSEGAKHELRLSEFSS